MDPWVRVQCSFDSHPDVMALDHVGRTVLQHLWRRAKQEMSEDGILARKYLSSRYLARACGIECQHCVAQIETQLELLFELGLLIDAGNEFEISNWNKYQTNTSNRDRQRRYREKQREEKYQNALHRNVTVTQRDVTVTQRNALEKKREEERRKKKEDSPEVCGTLHGHAEPSREKLRDERAVAFYSAMKDTQIMVRGSGVKPVVDALRYPERLANAFSDEQLYPGLSASFIGRAANWIAANPSRAKKDIGKYLHAWAAREKPGDTPINNKPRRILE